MTLLPFYDVLLVKKNDNLWSRVISKFLKDENGYVHSEYVIDKWLTLGTDITRPVSIHPFGYNLNEIDIYRYIGTISDKQREILVENIQKLTKTKYDVKEAICAGLGLSCTGKKDEYICITLITEVMEKAGLIPKGLSKKYRGFDVFTQSGFWDKL